MLDLRLKVPPVIVALADGGLMGGISHLTPALRLDFPGRPVSVWLLSAAGCWVAGAAVTRFLRAKTTVHPERPWEASALVTTGIYRVTRNPMYLGLLLLLCACALALRSAAALLLLPGFVAYLTRYQIRPEETALKERFGADYTAYCARVRRWL